MMKGPLLRRFTLTEILNDRSCMKTKPYGMRDATNGPIPKWICLLKIEIVKKCCCTNALNYHTPTSTYVLVYRNKYTSRRPNEKWCCFHTSTQTAKAATCE